MLGNDGVKLKGTLSTYLCYDMQYGIYITHHRVLQPLALSASSALRINHAEGILLVVDRGLSGG